MKNNRFSALTSFVAVVVLSLPAAFAAPGELWFDLENCDMCKNLTAEKDLMENMTWENHLTADGLMSVTVVAHGYEKAYQAASKNMEAAGARMMAGEKMNLCGFCQSYGTLVQAGANLENFQTEAGDISLVTSRDPAVIEKIHAHGQRTIDEYAKMAAAEGKGDKGHEGHGHSHGDH